MRTRCATTWWPMSWSTWPIPQAVLVLDETGFVKKGTKSVGRGARSTAARSARSPTARSASFWPMRPRPGPCCSTGSSICPRRGPTIRRAARRRACRRRSRCVPKPTLGRQLLERAFAAGVPAAWVTADSIYGGDYKLRHYLEEREQPFVLAVQSTQRVGLRPAAQVVASWPAEAWERLSAGEGSQGPRWYDWAWMPMSWRDASRGHGPLAAGAPQRQSARRDRLLLRLWPRRVHARRRSSRVAGTRWQVEQAFELAKGEVGLDEYEVRTWTGWYRHITLAMFALAYLTVVRQRAQDCSASEKGALRTGRRAAS